jgi:WD40 repeat protein
MATKLYLVPTTNQCGCGMRRTGEQLRELQGHTRTVTSVAFSPDGSRIVSGSLDSSVRVWDARTGEHLRELQGHTDSIWSVAFSPDGNRIVSGSYDKSVRVWDHLNLDAPWVLGEDGWIMSGAERLVWVPSTICNVLLRPHNVFIISRTGSATISFAQCKLGPLWQECYTP